MRRVPSCISHKMYDNADMHIIACGRGKGKTKIYAYYIKNKNLCILHKKQNV